jgi:hypothetical protein
VSTKHHTILPATSRINQHSLLDRLTPTPQQKKKKKKPKNKQTKNRRINKELKTKTQQRDGVAESTWEKWRGARS